MSLANELKKTLPVENQGLKEIEQYSGMKLPEDYEVTELLGDVIMVEFADCDESGELLNRGGILVSNDLTRNTWRIAKIIMVGPQVPESLQPGKFVMFPNDKGIPAVSRGGKPRSFLNAERIFGIVEPKK